MGTSLRRARAAAALVVAVFLLVPQAGMAGKAGPVFTDSWSSAYCSSLVGVDTTCDSTAHAEFSTETLGLNLNASSNLTPSTGGTDGYGTLYGNFTTNKAAKALRVTLNLHIDSGSTAEATTIGGDSSYAAAYTYASGFATASEGYGGTGAVLLDSNELPSRSNEDVTLEMYIVNCSSPGALLAAGGFNIYLDINGYAYVGSYFAPGTGTASVAFEATVTSFTAQTSKTAPAGICGF
jgi:hypothetical protein